MGYGVLNSDDISDTGMHYSLLQPEIPAISSDATPQGKKS